MKINQLSWTPLQDSLLWNSSKPIAKQSCPLEVQGCEPVTCLLSALRILNFVFHSHCIQGAPELHASKNSSFSVNMRFSRLPDPFWNLSHLRQKRTVSTFWKPTGLLVFYCDVNKIIKNKIYFIAYIFVSTF